MTDDNDELIRVGQQAILFAKTLALRMAVRPSRAYIVQARPRGLCEIMVALRWHCGYLTTFVVASLGHEVSLRPLLPQRELVAGQLQLTILFLPLSPFFILF